VRWEGRIVRTASAARTGSGRRLWRSLTALVSGLVLLVLGWPALPAHAADAVPGISGMVTLPGGAPAVGAYVCTYWSDGDTGSCDYAGADGSYTIGQTGESYVIGARLTGYVATYHSDAGGATAYAAATPVAVANGASVTGVDIRMVTGATISGTVRIGTQALGSARVYTANGDYNTSTGSDGRYSLQVPPGTVTLKATAYDTAADQSVKGSASLTVEDEHSYTLDINIPEGSGLAGTITLPDSPGSSVVVRAYRVTAAGESLAAENYQYYSGTTGAYAFRTLAAGSYIVRFSAGGYRTQCYGGTSCTAVTVKADQVTRPIDVTLVKASPGTLTGKVLDSTGAAISGVSVTAAYNTLTASATTDAAGAYTLPNLGSGLDWSLTFAKSGYGSRTTWATPKEGATTQVATMRLFGYGVVSGTIRGSGGAALPGASVSLSGGPYQNTFTTTTDAAGSYRFTNVPSGQYRLSAGATGYLPAYLPGVPDWSDASRISVPENKTSTVNLQLVKPATFSGTITDSAGKPMAGEVELYSQAYSDDYGYDSISTSSGSYSFTNLWPGTYTVRASASGRVGTWLGGGTTKASASWISVTAGAASGGHNIAVSSGQEVSGTVRDAAAQPRAGVEVELWGDDGGYGVFTDANGTFSISGVAPDTYSVAVISHRTTICAPDVAKHCSTPTVTVTATSAPSLSLTLPKLGSLSGAITLAGSAPDWTEISLTDSAGHRVLWDYYEGTSAYQVPDLPEGSYTLTVWAEGAATYSASVQISGATTRNVALTERPTISGTLSLAQDEARVMVAAIDPTTGSEESSTTIRNAKAGQVAYTLDDLDPGTYVVGASVDRGRHWTFYPGVSNPNAATRLQLTTANLTGINLAPTHAGWYQVTGKITPPAGVSADVLADAYFELVFVNVATDDDYNASVNLDGTYTVSVPKGSYVVSGSRSEDLGSAPLAGSLKVTANQTYNISLVKGGGFSGRLVDANGVGIYDATVWVTVDGETIAETSTDSWGYWQVDSLSAGAKATVHAEVDGFVGYASAVATVPSGSITELGNQALVRAGRLRISIPSLGETDLDEDDMTVYVVVTDLAGNELTRTSGWPGDVRTIGNIPVGKVLLRFQGRNILTEWWKDSATLAGATPITIAADQAAPRIAPILTRGPSADVGTLTGKVTNNSGLTGSLNLLLIDPEGDTQNVTVAADGTYSASIAPGTYKVRAAICQGLWMGQSGCMGTRLVGWYGGATSRNASPWVTVSAGRTTTANLDIFGEEEFSAPGTPGISGSSVVGATLTASTGTWTPAPAGFRYQWLRNGAAISGATSATYTLVAADLGATISVKVTGVRTGYQATWRTSAATAAVAPGGLTGPVPTVAGAARVGEKLTATTGTWTPAPTSFSYQWQRGGVAISGAAAASYVLTPADLGTAITVTVTAVRSGYTSVAKTSVATAKVVAGTLTTATPTIAGTVAVGSKLTASAGTWAPSPVALTYQWHRNGTAIAGATAATYTVQAADAGAKLTVTVTGAKPGYTTASRTSAATVAVPYLVFTPGTPSISGTAKVGSTLSAATGTWAPVPTSFGYQWNRAGKAIPGATGATYVVQAADAGAALTVTVTGRSAGYAELSKTSAATALVPTLAFTAAPVPTISGTAKVGSTLTAKTGTWTPTPDSFRYTWQRSGSVIGGATAATYELTTADAGQTITVTVTATKVGYASVSKTSTATAKVAKGAITGVVPTISGTVRVGETLTLAEGAWSPSGVTLRYQWYRSGKAIRSATAKTYVLTAAEAGKKITVKVTGSAAGYTSVTKASTATKKVAAGVLAAGTASISGTAKVGSSLTASAGEWGPAPVKLAYQWYRSGKAIKKATRTGYTLVAADQGRRITVKVTGTKAGYAKTAVASAPTVAVAAGTLTTAAPTISGTPQVGKKLTAKPGAWGPGKVTFAYQWKRNGQVIPKATKATYTATSADAGTKLTVVVTGSETGYDRVARESAAVAILA
jgi:hypothetical protein